MIVQAFLRWSEKAGSTERAKAANALGRAYLQSDMARENRDAAYMAMTYLLDGRQYIALTVGGSPGPELIALALPER